MKQFEGGIGRAGFTLIEVLVVLILLGLLSAAVLPVVTQQVQNGDPVRVSSDLAGIATGVRQFRLDVRPDMPQDLEDLVYAPAAADQTLNGLAYSNAISWNGPYIDAGLVEENSVAPDDAVLATGFGANIVSKLFCLGTGTAVLDLSVVECQRGNSVALRIIGISDVEAVELDSQIDGASDLATGRFRYDTSEDAAYYVLTPYF